MKRSNLSKLALPALAATLIAVTSMSALAQSSATGTGATTFTNACVACHQAGGVGMPGLAPSLAGTLAKPLAGEVGKRYVQLVLLNGLSGHIKSQGQSFNGAMPAQAQLDDATLAAVATYLAQDLNGLKEVSFSAQDFAQARASHPTHKELRSLREQSGL